MSKAIAQAYLDGYKEGYAVRKKKEESALFCDEVEYVDLGLPSGTLWASSNLMDDGVTCLMPFEEANIYELPSQEQFDELRQNCRWIPITNRNGIVGVKCIGKNRNSIQFNFFGSYVKPSGYREGLMRSSCFWLKGIFDLREGGTSVATVFVKGEKVFIKQYDRDCKFKFSVRLVKNPR